MTAAPEPTSVTARDIIDVSTSLADLLEKETHALRAMRVTEAERFSGEKMRLTSLYRTACAELEAGRLVLLNLAEALRQELIIAVARLTKAAAENERALRAGRAAVERVIAAIASAISEQRSQSLAYGRPRLAPPRLKPTSGVAFDRRL